MNERYVRVRERGRAGPGCCSLLVKGHLDDPEKNGDDADGDVDAVLEFCQSLTQVAVAMKGGGGGGVEAAEEV